MEKIAYFECCLEYKYGRVFGYTDSHLPYIVERPQTLIDDPLSTPNSS